MASTYSTNLGFELVGTGDQSGTWGTTNNTNIGTLIEQAISGYVTQVITDGADTTITIPNGASGVARNIFLELTGALTAARNLIVPSNKKLYYIYNNTSGGYAVTVKVSGQTGVSVPNGAKMVLVSNGTDVVLAENTVNGTLIPASVTLVSTAASQTLTNKTFNGGTVSGATITGATIISSSLDGSTNSVSNINLSTQVTGTLTVNKGGTGATTLTGYVLGNGTGAFTASTTIPTAALTGTLLVANGGTGATTLTGYLLGNGTSAITASTTIPTSALTGTLGIANGGTGQTTANAAFNALAPSQATNSGKFLTTDGTNTSWATVSTSSGTVTSVSGTGSANGLSLSGTVTASGNITLSGSISSVGSGATIDSVVIGYRSVPRSTTTGTIATSDVGKCVAVTAGITIPNSTFAAGDTVSIYNDSASSITITASVTTLRLAGTATTGNRTLAARGLATVWFNSATEAVISGAGVT